MSADEGSSQPPATANAPGSDKAAAPKTAATFSSFINKNTTGKKFAPKAARRRPGAPSAPTPTPSASETPASTPVQLPTPVATQEPVVTTVPSPLPTPSEPPSCPAPTTAHVQSQVDQPSLPDEAPSNAQGLTTQYLEDDVQAGRSPKRLRIEPPVEPRQQDNEPGPQPLSEGQGVVPTDAQVSTVVHHEAQSHVDATQHPRDTQVLPQPRKRRSLPWVAVNHSPQGSEEAAAITPAEQSHQHPNQRTKRKAIEPSNQDGGESPALPKKTRKPRKPKSALSSEVVEGPENEVGRIADEIVAAAVRHKPKPRRRRNATPEGDQIDGLEGEESTRQEKKRKGRPPREATPPEAENEVIDPANTFMDSLAAHDFRSGKLSAREKEMRTIDWEAVKQRRREEDSRVIFSKAEQEAADRALAEAGAELAAQAERGPRLRLNADGVMELVPESGTIDREGDAEKELEAMIVTEDQDVTARTTTRSFMKNNKRFPNEFLLPGQGRRWNSELTELFYQGLRSFGTDFQMISQMFPGFTRRSIKTKFTREERENPEGVKEALQGRSELTNGGWGVFLEKSNKTEESFADADEIKRQMAAKEAEFRERIAAAQAEAQERRRQRELAGIDEDGNPLGDGAGNKENGKGKKKRGKNKQVTFQEEQGVEIVGHVGDDDTWGQE
ncbi:uncharacterized protein yc1106_05971 [Curvularia clavata]|uniref:Transcription factor TFIIIB component B'' Myb domain-containing protein n=1 Tax=Curvularia clavata TaxID=95742 RepID=A0A9Q9DTE5_CURCL|nr:uncharacterized protein yc1106_05971 [Curvularia clavata]